ncbi:MAG: ATP-binding protein [Bacteroidota bacterium]
MALAVAESTGYKKIEGDCLANLGFIYGAKNFNLSIGYYFRSLKAYEEAGSQESLYTAMDAMAGIYYNMKKYGEALKYFDKERAYYVQVGNKYKAATASLNVAATYAEMGEHKRALVFLISALQVFEETGKKRQVAFAFQTIGSCYSALKEYNKALVYAAKSVRLSRSINDGSYAANFWEGAVLTDMANIYFDIAQDSVTEIRPDSLVYASKNANLAKAVQYFDQSFAIHKRLGFIPLDAAKRFSEALSKVGRHKEALEFYREYVKMKDSLFSNETQLKIAEQETRREAGLKEKQVALNRVQEAAKRNERTWFIVGVGLLSVIIILIVRNYRRQSEANVNLATANDQLAHEKHSLASEKEKSDELAANLQESIVQKDVLAAQLAVSAEMKTRFLANISHELRTPVTLLTGMLELMKDKQENKTGDNKEKLGVAYNNSRKLQHMVEEILDLSKLEGGELKMTSTTKEAAPMIKRMVYAFETFIHKERLTLEYTAERITGLYISVDEDRFEKTINNLVYNAIKFNKKGGWIKASVHPSADGHSLIFSISNAGGGISTKDLPHIFERFYQGDTSRAKAEGAGIGLSLVKEFTLVMGGTIAVTSDARTGTTFTLQFPLVEQAVEEEPTDAELPVPLQVWEHFPEKQTVLLVEDNTEMRYYLKEILGGKVNLAEAGNGIEALQWLETNTADLIISDIMMPEMDGREFIERVKSTPSHSKIPVITLTALADKESQLAMLRMGIDDYIIKPFNATELSVRVYNLLNNNAARLAANQQPDEPDDIPADGKAAEEFRSKITEYVLARIKNSNVSVYDLAYELNIGERQLLRLSKKLTGCSPLQLIREVRLQKAYELLLSGDIYKIEDVAKRVGFSTPAYFSRQFFERFGKKATEFL